LSEDNLLGESGMVEVGESDTGQIETGGEPEQVRARVLELESLLAEKEGEADRANTRIAELEQVVAEMEGSLAGAVSGYRTMAVETNPQVPVEMITGATIEEINVSLEKAIALVNRVKQDIEADMTAARIPAGAPERTPVNLEALSPREKIQYAIGGRR
jgi:hypothetical protein